MRLYTGTMKLDDATTKAMAESQQPLPKVEKPRTVAALIGLLEELPGDLPVSVEGCDCTGDWSGAIHVEEDEEGRYVVIASCASSREITVG